MFEVGISRNTKCDDLVSVPKSGHIKRFDTMQNTMIGSYVASYYMHTIICMDISLYIIWVAKLVIVHT